MPSSNGEWKVCLCGRHSTRGQLGKCPVCGRVGKINRGYSEYKTHKCDDFEIAAPPAPNGTITVEGVKVPLYNC